MFVLGHRSLLFSWSFTLGKLIASRNSNIHGYISEHISVRAKYLDAIVDIYDNCLKSLPALKPQPNKVFIRSDPGFWF